MSVFHASLRGWKSFPANVVLVLLKVMRHARKQRNLGNSDMYWNA